MSTVVVLSYTIPYIDGAHSASLGWIAPGAQPIDSTDDQVYVEFLSNFGRQVISSSTKNVKIKKWRNFSIQGQKSPL